MSRRRTGAPAPGPRAGGRVVSVGSSARPTGQGSGGLPRWRRVLGPSLFLAFLLLAGAWLARHRYTDPGPLAQERTVVVPRGGVGAISRLLLAQGVIRSSQEMQWGVRLLGGRQPLQAGEYAIPARASLQDVIALLQSGRTVVHHLTVPEGLTSAQIMALVAADPVLDGPVPNPVPADGTLLPETYNFSLGESREALVRRMAAAMRREVETLWAARDPKLALRTPEEAVALASLVEKETALPQERPHIAAVFLNRLRLGMRLQSDPTVIYALSGGKGELDRPLTHADLATPSPYNTYVAAGLPAGPIANPGRASLLAVLHPLDSPDLYFVADGSGGHAFAATLDQHNRNVAKWRDLRRERG